MTLESVFFVCFLVGFALSLVSFLTQTFHFHGHFGHWHASHGHHGGWGHGAAHGQAAHAHSHHGPGHDLSAFNMMTATAFLAWFGGSGYLLERYSGWWLGLVIVAAIGIGLTGAFAVFWVMRKLVGRDHTLDPADYEMAGVLGRITSTVFEGGTGEMSFSREGVRRATPVRSEDGARLEKGTEVIITRYANGVAYARRWEDEFGVTSSQGN